MNRMFALTTIITAGWLVSACATHTSPHHALAATTNTTTRRPSDASNTISNSDADESENESGYSSVAGDNLIKSFHSTPDTTKSSSTESHVTSSKRTITHGTSAGSKSAQSHRTATKTKSTHSTTTVKMTAEQKMDKAIKGYLAKRRGPVGIAVYNLNTKKEYTYHADTLFMTASTIKVSILVDLLHQNKLTEENEGTVRKMIENSDNDAATELWATIGKADAMNEQFETLGMTHSKAGEHWGLTQTSASDQLKLLELLVDNNSYISSSQKQYVLNLMTHVESDQRWGVSAGVTGASVSLKNGWAPFDATHWRVNSIGYVHGNHRNYLIAVYTYNNPSMDYGVNTIDQVSRYVWEYNG